MHSFYSEDTEHYFWPIIFALTLHILLFAALFISFSSHINFPQPKPLVQVKLYQLKSQSQASTVTDQKVAGAAKKTAAKQYEAEQLELKKNQQNKINIEKKKADELKKKLAADSEAKKKAVAKAKELAAAKKIADIKKKAEQKKVAEEAKRKAEEAKRKAEEEKKKKVAEEAKRKAEEEKKKKAAEDKKAAAQAELLADDVQRKQTAADTQGDQVAGDYDDLFRQLITEQWRRPASARNGMVVEILIEMLPDGTITNVSVAKSSGDVPFDNSAVQAVKNVGRVVEIQSLDRAKFEQQYRKRKVIFRPEDLTL